ncbi:MAG: agmatinase [Candidatus Thermoplasmatota archaeon]|jgi:arginase/agmatinase|nr:agmatinase [Candidatus Thermoplasmatota archaeon]
MPSPLKFCDSSDTYETSKYVLFGVPFDSTVSFRPGERLAPNRIRESSYNIESYSLRKKYDIRDAGLYDMGDISEHHNPEDMLEEVFSTVDEIVSDGKFPIMLGGEHSITTGAVRRLKKKVVFIDAHTDFRDSYLRERYSHASVARRVSEIVEKRNIVSLGIRSISPEEIETVPQKFFTSYEIRNDPHKALEYLKQFADDDIYFSIDFDGFDPSFAPGVGTPEPFGIDPIIVLDIMEIIKKKIVGVDLVEMTPLYDNGNTSMLAARLIQEIIASIESDTNDK